MKKSFAAVFIALMLLFMAECASNGQNEDSTASEKETEEVAAPSVSPSESTEENPAEEVKEFPLKLEKTVESLNDSLESIGVTLADPKVSPGESSDMGKHVAYTYSLGSGASLCIYVSESTQHILNFTVLTVASETDNQTLFNVGYLIGCLESGLAGDEAARVDEELNMQGLEVEAFATSSTDSADFLYMVQAGSLVFMVTPA